MAPTRAWRATQRPAAVLQAPELRAAPRDDAREVTRPRPSRRGYDADDAGRIDRPAVARAPGTSLRAAVDDVRRPRELRRRAAALALPQRRARRLGEAASTLAAAGRRRALRDRQRVSWRRLARRVSTGCRLGADLPAVRRPRSPGWRRRRGRCAGGRDRRLAVVAQRLPRADDGVDGRAELGRRRPARRPRRARGGRGRRRGTPGSRRRSCRRRGPWRRPGRCRRSGAGRTSSGTPTRTPASPGCAAASRGSTGPARRRASR